MFCSFLRKVHQKSWCPAEAGDQTQMHADENVGAQRERKATFGKEDYNGKNSERAGRGPASKVWQSLPFDGGAHFLVLPP